MEQHAYPADPSSHPQTAPIANSVVRERERASDKSRTTLHLMPTMKYREKLIYPMPLRWLARYLTLLADFFHTPLFATAKKSRSHDRKLSKMLLA
jgi:hypothetical protein